jgi:ECF transporter S component (folate family)
MAFINTFKHSAMELKSVRCLAVTGVLLAIFVILRGYTSIQLSPALRVNFAFLALAAIAMLYGPVVAMIAAIPGDILSAILLGGTSGILPGLTLVWIFNGLIYGMLLYNLRLEQAGAKRAKITSARLIVAHAIVVFIGRLVFNTAILHQYGIIGGSDATVQALITARVVTQMTLFPIDLLVLFMMLAPIKIAYVKTMGRTT